MGVNITQKRYAVASSLAASAVPALIMARGHVVDEVPEVPLVLDTAIESTSKTSAAKDILAALDSLDEIYGTLKKIPTAPMANADLARIINSDEIQSVLNAPKDPQKIYAPKANPLKSIEALEKLDAFAAKKRKAETGAPGAKKDKKKIKAQYKNQGEEFYAKASKQG